MKRGESVLCFPTTASCTQDAHPFYGSAWDPNRCDSHLNSTWRGSGREKGRVGMTGLCARRHKDGWSCLLQDLRSRGATQMDLMVTDGHEGLLAAVSALFSATPRPRCVVHKQPSAAQRHSQSGAQRGQQGIRWDLAPQEKKEDALLNLAAFQAKYQKRYPEAIRSLCEDEEHLLTFFTFPPVMH